jgi:hypothetical protein
MVHVLSPASKLAILVTVLAAFQKIAARASMQVSGRARDGAHYVQTHDQHYD